MGELMGIMEDVRFSLGLRSSSDIELKVAYEKITRLWLWPM